MALKITSNIFSFYFPRRISLSLIVIAGFLLILFLGSCAERKMSIEEAKQVTISMNQMTHVSPPRHVDDIISILSTTSSTENSRFDIRKVREFHKMPMASKISDSHLFKGDVAMVLGRFNEALKEFRLAFEEGKQRKLIWRLAVMETACGNYKRAVELHEFGIKMYPDDFSNYSHLVRIYSRCGNIELAEKYMKNGIQLCINKSSQKVWVNWSRSHKARMQAHFLEGQGKHKEAETYFKEQIKWANNESEFYGTLLRFDLARNYMKQGLLNEAEIEARETLKQLIIIFGQPTDIIGYLSCELGEIVQRQGRLEDAEKLIKAGLRIIENANVVPDSYLMGIGRVRLGNVLAQQLKFDEARTAYDSARLSMIDSKYQFERDFARNPNLILTYLKTKDVNTANTFIDTSYEVNKTSYGLDNYETAEILGLRAIGKALTNDYKNAMSNFAAAMPVLLKHRNSYIHDASKKRILGIIIEAYMDLLATTYKKQISNNDEKHMVEIAFNLADSLCGQSAQSAISANSDRMAASNDPELSDLVRKEQDANNKMEEIADSYASMLASSKDQQIPALIEQMKQSLQTIKMAHTSLLEEIKP